MYRSDRAAIVVPMTMAHVFFNESVGWSPVTTSDIRPMTTTMRKAIAVAAAHLLIVNSGIPAKAWRVPIATAGYVDQRDVEEPADDHHVAEVAEPPQRCWRGQRRRRRRQVPSARRPPRHHRPAACRASTPSSRTMNARAVDGFLSVVWIAFWIYWIAAATGAKASRPWTARGGLAGVRVGAMILVLALLRTPLLRGHSLTVHSAPLQAVGLALFLLGLAAAVWARLHLGANWGVPMSQRVEPDLITSGPYRFVRHPIYSGVLLALVGTALASSLYWFLGVGLIGVYFVYSARVEERSMTEQFPTHYPAYRSRTRMLIPFIL
jgi:protein-S-isoprenylcysteine O-methyltransferase Ste14